MCTDEWNTNVTSEMHHLSDNMFALPFANCIQKIILRGDIDNVDILVRVQ